MAKTNTTTKVKLKKGQKFSRITDMGDNGRPNRETIVGPATVEMTEHQLKAFADKIEKPADQKAEEADAAADKGEGDKDKDKDKSPAQSGSSSPSSSGSSSPSSGGSSNK